MVDVFGAERAKGARFATACTFADGDSSEAARAKAQDGWHGKNVEPILYDRRHDHRDLAETLIEPAAVRRDTHHAGARIAINATARMPDDPVPDRGGGGSWSPPAAPTGTGNQRLRIDSPFLPPFPLRCRLCCGLPSDAASREQSTHHRGACARDQTESGSPCCPPSV